MISSSMTTITDATGTALRTVGKQERQGMAETACHSRRPSMTPRNQGCRDQSLNRRPRALQQSHRDAGTYGGGHADQNAVCEFPVASAVAKKRRKRRDRQPSIIPAARLDDWSTRCWRSLAR